MCRFHLGKARQNGAHAELAGLAAIHAGKQRISETIHHFAAVVPLDK